MSQKFRVKSLEITSDNVDYSGLVLKNINHMTPQSSTQTAPLAVDENGVVVVEKKTTDTVNIGSPNWELISFNEQYAPWILFGIVRQPSWDSTNTRSYEFSHEWWSVKTSSGASYAETWPAISWEEEYATVLIPYFNGEAYVRVTRLSDPWGPWDPGNPVMDLFIYGTL